jgi:hypothetical protein
MKFFYVVICFRVESNHSNKKRKPLRGEIEFIKVVKSNQIFNDSIQF